MRPSPSARNLTAVVKPSESSEVAREACRGHGAEPPEGSGSVAA
ncbi:hypothetical protein ACFPM0_33495 [Pseudonocardia sulfidoxydans]